MSKIRILPEQIANRIAAGEVIERPASVVKELIENSLDAGADRIIVEIDGGGTRLIKVIDNGEGMSEDDLLLSLERHGTSKIINDHDLDNIKSLGFRGEAIPSIASVSKFSITSRTDTSPLGNMVVINYGKLTQVKQAGANKGTIVEVKNLFGNTPARLKFLKTRKTELSHIYEIVKYYSLGAENVSFRLVISGKDALFFSKEQSLLQRIQSILHYSGEFIKVSTKTNISSNKISLTGFIVPPDVNIRASTHLLLFVNGRAVKDKILKHAVLEAFSGFIMKGKGISGFLNLKLPADNVDVNVHPAKHEVRFHNSKEIAIFISTAISKAFKKYQQSLQNEIFQNRKESRPIANTPTKETTYTNHQPTHTVSEPPPSVDYNTSTEVNKQPKLSYPETKKHNFRIIGQFKDLYILCQSENGLFVIDQHAAHERLVFEDLKKNFFNNTIHKQSLLFPVTVELSAQQIQVAENYSSEIDKLGFSVSEFGGNSYIISAIPAISAGAIPDKLFIEILDNLATISNINSIDGIHNLLSNMACKAAIKSGDRLHNNELDDLLNKMAKADLFSHCPHGRPVFKQFTDLDIKKWFHRT